MSRILLLSGAMFACILAAGLHGQTSQLWGNSGELWNPDGRLPDYSYAGYHGGEVPIPDNPATSNVRNFGAVGNGSHDDTQAFNNAIAAAGQNGVVLVPRGRYKISDVLHINRSNVVLRGEGDGDNDTVLAFTSHLTTYLGANSAWNDGKGGLIWVGQLDWNSWAAGLGPYRAHVTANAQRGDTTIQVGNAGSINVGDFIMIRIDDPSGRPFGRHLHNFQAQPGNCSYMPLAFKWSVKVVAKSGNTLTLAQPLRFDIDTGWNPRVYSHIGVREVGIENLQIECRPHPYAGHLQEPGYNAVCLQGTVNCWVRGVRVKNCDSGFIVRGQAKWNTFKDISIDAGTDGHYGLSSLDNANDNLFEDFQLDPNFIHDVSVSHQANGNVYHRGAGSNINLDHHKDQPFENLFSDIHCGASNDIHSSGGASCAGPNAAARETMWNVRTNSSSFADTPSWGYIQTNVIPAATNLLTMDRQWFEHVPNLTPLDLFESQRNRRLGAPILDTVHTVVTFDDQTTGGLVQEEGPPVQIGLSAAHFQGTTRGRLVDTAHQFDDQIILLETGQGMPPNAQIGAMFRAPSPTTNVGSGTRFFIWRTNTSPGAPNTVRAHLKDETGLHVSSPTLMYDAENSVLQVRAQVAGTNFKLWINDDLVLDYTGIQDTGPGYTSVFGERHDSFPGGALAVKNFEALQINEATNVHRDSSGTVWLSIYVDGLFDDGFAPGLMMFALNDLLVDYQGFRTHVAPFLEYAETFSPHHVVVAFRSGTFTSGDVVSFGYAGVVDQLLVP